MESNVIQKYKAIYHNSYLKSYYDKNTSEDGWCYETDLYVISDNGKNLKLIADQNVIIDFLIIPDFDDTLLIPERASFKDLRTDNKGIFAWRVTPTQYRLKGTEFKKPEWVKGE